MVYIIYYITLVITCIQYNYYKLSGLRVETRSEEREDSDNSQLCELRIDYLIEDG